MWLFITAAVVFLSAGGPTSAKIVRTIYGEVDGNTVPVDGDTLVNSWYGIPFARPPIGDLRFEPPVNPEAWSGVRQAKTLPDACIQDAAGLVWLTHPGWNNYSEDCLTLNIYAPDNLEGGSLPVMVWFHGGGYVSGSNIQYPGHFMAARGVVIVVPNYRLDSFGFLATPDGTLKGNMGLYDQAAALRWVRDNIAAFGGSPSRVTIFGQSAGAGSASLHMLSPLSRGLFSSAILESGSENNLWTLNYPNQEPEQYVYQLAARVNCERETDPEMVQCLKSRAPGIIRAGQSVTCKPGFFCQGYAPIVDGPNGFIPKIPLEMREELDASRVVPTLGGICRDDGSLYTLFLIPGVDNGDGFNSTEFEYSLKEYLLNIFAAQFSQEQYDQVYNALRWYYVTWPYLEDKAANRDAFNQLITDGAFGYAWDRQLKLISAKNSDTYAYVQSFISNNASSFIPPWMGVPHTAEVAYVWGYGKMLDNPAVREDSGIFFDVVGWTELDALYSDYQVTLWTNFAKFHNPTPQPVKAPFNDTLTTWDKFSINDDLKVFDLDWEPFIQKNFRQQRNAFYTDYLSSILGRPIMSNKAEKPARPAGNFRFDSDIIKKKTREFVLNTLKARGVELPDLEKMEDY